MENYSRIKDDVSGVTVQRRRKKTGEDDDEDDDNVAARKDRSWCSRWAGKTFTKKQLFRKIPVLDWLPKYDLDKGVSDLIAGITVGLTVVPQAIAYAIVAEIPPQYGLYSSFMGCFVYLVFGSCKDVTVGPTAIMSLITAEHAHGRIDFVVLLSFLSGIIIWLFGMLRLGFVIEFISIPVIAGFTSAASITIASGQVMGLFGLTLAGTGHNSSDVPGLTGTCIDIVNSFETIRYQDSILGWVCIVILLLMREMNNVKWFDETEGEEHPSRCQISCSRLSPLWRKILKKAIWGISTARNAIVVIVCIGIAYAFDPVLPDDPNSRNTTFILTGTIESGLPPFQLPPFETEVDGEQLDFGGMLQELGSALIVAPLIAIIESIAIAKAFAAGKPIDGNQEMIALGLSNVAGSFVSSMPTTGSFSRTALNANSGVRTTFGGIYTGTLVILTLLVLMPACAYIPKAALAAVIITAVIFSVEYHVVKPMYKSKKSDLFCGIVTFLCCLFWSLELGILVGMAIQVCYILYYTARPTLQVVVEQLKGPGTEFMVVSMDRALLFPAINYIRNLINKAALRRGHGRMPVVVDCQYIFATDFTGVKGLDAMAADFGKRQQPIVFINAKEVVESTLLGHGGGKTAVIIVRSAADLRQTLEGFFSSATEEGQSKGKESQIEYINNGYINPDSSSINSTDAPSL